MPKKTQIEKERILQEALCLIREEGEGALNARRLAERLGCSTQPLFSRFPSMGELKKELISEAGRLYGTYVKKDTESGRFPPYKASGMAYIRFAAEEKALFRLLFMRDRRGEAEEENGFGGLVESLLAMLTKTLGVDREGASFFHLEMWAYVHGIAAMAATSYLTLDEETVSTMLTDMFEGLKMRYGAKGERK